MIEKSKTRLEKILLNGVWLPIPSLLLFLMFARHLPVQFQADHFWKDIPDVVKYGENIFRIMVYLMPLFFSIGISTKKQKLGLIWYITGMAVYFLSWVPLVIVPNSGWSTSMIGFMAPAYTPLLWLIGIGLLGETFYYRLNYRPVYYIGVSVIFLIFHCTHVMIIYLRYF